MRFFTTTKSLILNKLGRLEMKPNLKSQRSETSNIKIYDDNNKKIKNSSNSNTTTTTTTIIPFRFDISLSFCFFVLISFCYSLDVTIKI
jgi:hypothetical protein